MHKEHPLIDLPPHTRSAPPAEPRGWRWWAFIVAFMMAMGAAVSMVVHAVDARGSGKENAFTPAFMVAVQVLKLPKLWDKYRRKPTTVNLLLAIGSIIGGIVWAIALGYAL